MEVGEYRLSAEKDCFFIEEKEEEEEYVLISALCRPHILMARALFDRITHATHPSISRSRKYQDLSRLTKVQIKRSPSSGNLLDLATEAAHHQQSSFEPYSPTTLIEIIRLLPKPCHEFDTTAIEPAPIEEDEDFEGESEDSGVFFE